MKEPGDCIICGEAGATKWTLNMNGDVAIASLCPAHSEPLHQVMEASSKAPPAGGPAKRKRTSDTPQRIEKKRTLEPLDWTPPEES